MRAERFWQQALAVSEAARHSGALVPLTTRRIEMEAMAPFILRELLSRPPRHLRPEAPRHNPFLPWDAPLQVDLLADRHVLLLNKYPVQAAHLLVISRDWQPQSGWLTEADWQAVAMVGADTGGLWFFNSHATAGASQPHRHLQLLPRRADEPSCPLAARYAQQLAGLCPPSPWAHCLSRRHDPRGGSDLPELYADHCARLGLGRAASTAAPEGAYNLLFDDDWFLTVKRVREHGAGFSVNALGFAGFLLCTPTADRAWLERHGPWSLLAEVAAAA